jgi:hypothetical protein
VDPCKSRSKPFDINMMRVNFYRVEGNGIVECQSGRFLTPPQENKCLLRENSSGTKSKLVLKNFQHINSLINLDVFF